MATPTVLDMTQNILSAMNSDAVNSISDTTESMQVARIIQNKYYDILTRGNLPEQQVLLQFTASGDADKPVLMYVPAGVTRIDWVKYFDANTDTATTPGYKYVTGLSIAQFIDMINSFNPEDDNVESFNFTEGGSDFIFYYKTDRQPCYYTVIENRFIIFDSYNVDLDTTLQESKTEVFGLKVTPFVLSDTHVPDMNDTKFSLLLNEAKALAFYELKQVPHQKAEQEIKRQWSSIQKDKAVSNKPSHFDQLPDFGRSSRGFGPNRWMREA